MNGHVRSSEVLRRLAEVRWDAYPALQHRKSRLLLVREYLRRSAQMVESLHCAEWPLIDFARYVDPALDLDSAARQQLQTLQVPSYVRDLCCYAVKWAMLDAAKLADPFEPMLLLFERGGYFTMEHGFIDVAVVGIRTQSYRDYLNIQALDDMSPLALDELDAEDRVRFGD